MLGAVRQKMRLDGFSETDIESVLRVTAVGAAGAPAVGQDESEAVSYGIYDRKSRRVAGAVVTSIG